MKFLKHVKLGVNIDHIATLRQARKRFDPDPIAAARLCQQAGADMIVVHLRQDRRHIQTQDFLKLCSLNGKTHLEMAPVPETTALALKGKPRSVCLVPERAGEITTEGGLNLLKSGKALGRTIAKLKKANINVSLFINPEASSVRSAKSLGADTVELCTSAYCGATSSNKKKIELERLELAGYLAHELGLDIHAGHDLGYHNVRAVANIPNLECLNIGFSIVARAVFVGLKMAVAEMRALIS